MDNRPEEQTSVFGIGLFLILIAFVLVVALIQNATPLIILCVCILVLSYGAKLWARVSTKKIQVTLHADKIRSFPEDSITFSVGIENQKVIPVWAKLDVATEFAEETFSYETGLLSFSDSACRWAVSSSKRGVYKVGPIRVLTGDLLGFYRVEKEYDKEKEIVVYPKLTTVKQRFFSSREYFGNRPGSEFVDDPVLISGTREYGFSTPAKNIHWKASAKTLALQEKVFEPSSHIKILMVVDVRGFKENGASDAFEKMLSVAASYAVFFFQKGIFPGLFVNGCMTGDELPFIMSFEGCGDIHGILEKLARLTFVYNEKYDAYMKNLEKPGKQTCLYFCYQPPQRLDIKGIKENTVEMITSISQKDQYGYAPVKVNCLDDLIED